MLCYAALCSPYPAGSAGYPPPGRRLAALSSRRYNPGIGHSLHTTRCDALDHRSRRAPGRRHPWRHRPAAAGAEPAGSARATLDLREPCASRTGSRSGGATTCLACSWATGGRVHRAKPCAVCSSVTGGRCARTPVRCGPVRASRAGPGWSGAGGQLCAAGEYRYGGGRHHRDRNAHRHADPTPHLRGDPPRSAERRAGCRRRTRACRAPPPARASPGPPTADLVDEHLAGGVVHHEHQAGGHVAGAHLAGQGQHGERRGERGVGGPGRQQDGIIAGPS